MTNHSHATSPQQTGMPIPHDPALERGLLGAILTYGISGRQLLDGLDVDAFWVPAHRALLGAIRSLVDRGIDPDVPMVTSALGAHPDRPGGSYLVDIVADAAGSQAQAEQYARVLRSLHRQRRAISIAHELMSDPGAGLGRVREQLADLAAESESEPDPMTRYTEHDARHADLPDRAHIVPGMLPTGLTVLVAAPKLRKSFLAQQIEHYLATGQPLLARQTPELPHRCMVIDFEGDKHQTNERSWMLTDWLDNEALFDNIVYVHDHELPDKSVTERLDWLRSELDRAKRAGNPWRYVRIDTLRRYIGPKPKGVDAYTADYETVSKLNNLAKEYGLAILAIHHTNNDGGINGSVAAIQGGSEACWFLDRQDTDDYRVLGTITGIGRSIKEFKLAAEFVDGWRLTEELIPAEISHQGIGQDIVRILAEHGPHTVKRLKAHAVLHGVAESTVRKTLARLHARREVNRHTGQGKVTWALADQAPQAPEPEPEPEDVRPLTESMWDGWVTPGQAGTATSATRATSATSATSATREQVDTAPPAEPRPTKAMDALRASVSKSTKRPLRRVLPDDRNTDPWRALEHPGVKGHRWIAPYALDIADGHEVVVLDRRGSFPSAMSSVVVGAGPLRPHGAIAGPLPGKAGVYLITQPPWEDSWAPPLGRWQRRGGNVWVTDPHLKLLLDLDLPVTILDSYLSTRATTLFRPFSQWAAARREDTLGTGAYADIKHDINVTIQMLHTASPSGFWRPDWLQAIHAEAWVRHWVKARAADTAHHHVIGLLNEDEAHVLCPEGTEPPGFAVGPRFGQYSIKGRYTIEAWSELTSVRSAR